MSWIVQNLWNNRTRIKEKSHPTIRDISDTAKFNSLLNRDLLQIGHSNENDSEYIVEPEPSYEDPFIESDEFNDLLMIEKAVDELEDLGLLSEEDLQLLGNSAEGSYHNQNRQRKTDARHFYFLCERIAYYLGGYFTDEGYINYLTRKFNLNTEQQDIARDYMKSKFKNKILSKGYKSENNHDKINAISTEV